MTRPWLVVPGGRGVVRERLGDRRVNKCLLDDAICVTPGCVQSLMASPQEMQILPAGVKAKEANFQMNF